MTSHFPSLLCTALKFPLNFTWTASKCIQTETQSYHILVLKMPEQSQSHHISYILHSYTVTTAQIRTQIFMFQWHITYPSHRHVLLKLHWLPAFIGLTTNIKTFWTPQNILNTSSVICLELSLNTMRHRLSNSGSQKIYGFQSGIFVFSK